jgi:hypothetical protein
MATLLKSIVTERPLLGSTDRKWMVEKWGEPTAHTTAQTLYQDLHSHECERVSKLTAKHDADTLKSSQAAFEALIDKIDARESLQAKSTSSIARERDSKSQKTGFFVGLLRGFLK